MFEIFDVKNGQELTLERLKMYIREKIENDDFFTFDEIRMSEICGLANEFYTPDDPTLTYKDGYFYTSCKLVHPVDNEKTWCEYKWKYGPNKPKMAILGLLENKYEYKIMFDDVDTKTVLMRYIRETYHISDDDVITAIVTINKNLPSFNEDSVVYVKPEDLHSNIEQFPPVSFKCPEGKIITEEDVNNREYMKECAKKMADTFGINIKE